jgi:hypothetical protein
VNTANQLCNSWAALQLRLCGDRGLRYVSSPGGITSALLQACKRCKVSPADLVVGSPSQGSWFGENPNRSFAYNPEVETHTLSVPQPFDLSLRWPLKPFQPAFAHCEDSAETNALCTRFSPPKTTGRELKSTWKRPTGGLDKPTLSTRSQSQTPNCIWRVQGLYGVESYFSVGLPRHPC